MRPTAMLAIGTVGRRCRPSALAFFMRGEVRLCQTGESTWYGSVQNGIRIARVSLATPEETRVINFPESRALLSKTRRLLISSKRLLKYLNDHDVEPDSRDRLTLEEPNTDAFDRSKNRFDPNEAQGESPKTLGQPEDRETSSVVWDRPRRPR
jgi:hypothetical protein